MAGVELVPMTSEEFQAWLPDTIESYAAEHVRTGRWSQGEALERSREEHDRLLPQGVATPDHRLSHIVPAGGGEPVGLLWFQVIQKPAPSAARIRAQHGRQTAVRKARLRADQHPDAEAADLEVGIPGTVARRIATVARLSRRGTRCDRQAMTEQEKDQAHGRSPRIPADMQAFNRQLIGEYRTNQGRLSGRLAGMQVLLLTTKGARTGKPRTAVVGYRMHGESYVTIASNNGAPRHPAWYLNLLAEPVATVEVGAEKFHAKARSATSAEREELARLFDYLERQQARTEREIPIVILDRTR